jgi:hypothetical protein
LFGFISHMTDRAEANQPQRRSSCPWLLFCGGLVAAAAVYILPPVLGDPWWAEGEPDTSFFARYLSLPLLTVSFCCCCASPFTSSFIRSLSPAVKFAAVFAAAFSFLIASALAMGVAMLLCPDLGP